MKTESGANRQYLSWASITARVPQGSILRTLVFLIYINDLSENLSSNPKLFADDTSENLLLNLKLFVDDTSLISVVHNLTTTNNRNEDLERVNDWTTQWKRSFNLDPTKQAQEAIFSRKIIKTIYTPLNFNNKISKQTVFNRHLGLTLDSQVSFEEQLKTISSKVNKTIGLIEKLK